MSRKRIVIVVSGVVAVVAITLGVRAFTVPGAPGGMPEHITIAQARAESERVVRVGGEVVPGSVGWDDASRTLRFTLTGDGERLPVTYQGPAPNDFKPGSAVVVEGTYASRGIFEAKSLTTRSSPLCKACHG